MTGWAILGAVILLLLLAGQIGLRVGAEHTAQKTRAWAELGPVRLQLWPRRAERPAKGRRPARPPAGAPAGEQPEKGGLPAAKLEYVRALLPVLLETGGRFRRKLRVDVLHLQLRIGADDPADAAMYYGQANGLLGGIWDPVVQTFHVVDGTVQVLLDFNAPSTTLSGNISLSIKLYQFLWLGLHFAAKSCQAALGAKRRIDEQNKQRKAV